MKFLRIKQVSDKTGLSRSTIYRLEAAGAFPKRVQLSQGTVAWHESAVDDWMKERIQAR
ncbi:MAG: AlpA family transcriptional regulator [Deltaproteobacteria bacterium]|nr:MAG: AlpA family transcriptional regulator [Deltaproteobacteria bacterium]